MNRAEAVKTALATVSELEKAPTKQNGYPVDGWRAVTFTDRVEAVLRIAGFLESRDADGPSSASSQCSAECGGGCSS